jgi:hypothetical protein
MRLDDLEAKRKQRVLLRHKWERRRLLLHFAARMEKAGESEIAVAFRTRARDAKRQQFLLNLSRLVESLGQRKIASALRSRAIAVHR